MIQTTPAVNLLKDEGAYRVLAAAQAIEKTGKKVVHLEIGQPGFPTPKYIAEVGQRAIADGFTTYVNPSGTMEIKEAIAHHIRETRNVAAVTADNVVVGPGAKPGLFFAAQAVIRAGDEVLIPDPGFPTYENLVKLFGGVSVRYNALSATIASEVGSKLTPKTRLVILNSPSNPTGRIFSREENKLLADELRKFPAVWIVSDEIYCHLIYEDNNDAFATAPSIIGEPGMQDRTIIIDGFSKTFSMTGWRLGFAICNAELAKKLHLLMTHAVGCTASFSQRAGTVALTQKEDMRREVQVMVREYRKRRDYVVERLSSMRGVKCAPPRGAFYAFADVSGCGVSARELCDRCLNEGLVAILPGGDFGPNGEDFIRISYVGTMEVLKEGLDRMEKVVNGLLQAGKGESPSKRVKA